MVLLVYIDCCATLQKHNADSGNVVTLVMPHILGKYDVYPGQTLILEVTCYPVVAPV